MNMKNILLLILGLIFSVFLAFSNPNPGLSYSATQTLSPARIEAKAALQKGFLLWDPEMMKSARDRFLALLLTEKSPDDGLFYDLAVADFRLASYFLASQNITETERYGMEARKYVQQALDKDPLSGESYALDAYLIGVEIALHPEQAMNLFSESINAFTAAFAKSPNNPRVHLLKALSVYYTPEAYGGGPGNAQEIFEKSLTLFEKEKASNPSRSSWGQEEAYAYLGLCFKQQGAPTKAREMLKKALAVSPNYAFAAHELQVLGDK